MPSIWAIADLHLSFGVPNKSMEIFGPQWADSPAKIREQWLALIAPEDLVLIPGDISWAMRIEEARPDLEWIDSLPGTKVMIRGNHDYWWSSLSQIAKICPPSIHLIQNNAFHWNGVGVAGTRLWDCPDFSFGAQIDFKENPKANKEQKEKPDTAETRKIWERELSRLELSLKCLDARDQVRLAMVHYPPLSADLRDSEVSLLLKRYGVTQCLFGHLHNVNPTKTLFGDKEGIRYALTACDYLQFKPLKVLTL
jgi:predicted phosphohydrolase